MPARRGPIRRVTHTRLRWAPVAVGAHVVTVNQAVETDLAQPVTVRKTVWVGEGYQAAVMALSPAMYWRLGQNVNGANYDLVAGTVLTSSGIALGQTIVPGGSSRPSFDLDGANVAGTGYNPFTNGTKRSFAGWYRRDSDANIAMLWGGSHATDDSAPYLFAGGAFGFGARDVYFAPNGNAAGNVGWINALPVTGEVAHVVLVFEEDTDTAELFVNGVSKGAQTATAQWGTTGAYSLNLVLGYWVNSAAFVFPWLGEQQHFATWHRALSGSEIEGLYQAGFPAVRETDTAQAVNDVKSRTVGQVTETDVAQPVTVRKTTTLGQASETDEAQPVTERKAVTLGQPAESDTAQPVAVRKIRAVGQSAETDLARPVTGRKTVTLGQASETDEAFPVIGPARVNQATETDLAQPVTARKTVTVGQAAETDTANGLTVRRSYTLGQPAETDLAQPVAPLKRRTVNQAVETDTAQLITARRVYPVGQAAETDVAFAITVITEAQPPTPFIEGDDLAAVSTEPSSFAASVVEPRSTVGAT